MLNKYIRYTQKLVLEAIGIPIYAISKVVPKNNKIWVFGEWHGQRYADNSSYLYEHVSQQHSDIRAVWITKNKAIVKQLKNKGNKVYLQKSILGYYYSAKAKVHIVTHDTGDTNPYLSGNSLVISLTHGTPLKKIGKDAQYKRLGFMTPLFDRFVAPILPSKQSPGIIFCANSLAALRFSSATENIPKIISYGYPRWDGLINKHTNPWVMEKIKNYDTVVSYMPTLRFNNQVQYDPLSVIGFKDLVKFLEANKVLLIIRPHPVMQFKDESTNSTNVIFMRSERVPDVFDILKHTDILITDYSSVMYDYAQLNRPIILLSPDADVYISEDVGVYGDYYKDALGPVFDNWLQVKSFLEHAHKTKSITNKLEHNIEEGVVSNQITMFIKNYIKTT